MGCNCSALCNTIFRAVVSFYRNYLCCGSEIALRNQVEAKKKDAVTSAMEAEPNQNAEQSVSKTAHSFEEESSRLMVDNRPLRTEDRSDYDDERSLRDFEDSLKPTEEEMEKDRKLKMRENELKKQLEEVMTKMSRLKSESVSDGSYDQGKEAEEEFEREMAEQREIFERKMEKLREKRAEIERETALELERMKQESAERMQMFLKCILMKMRFEEKENEWKQMLDGLRKPIVKVCCSYYELQSQLREVRREDLHEFDKENLENNGKSFGRKVAVAQELLYRAFHHLDALSKEYDDRVFIKIIMKSLSELGYQCNYIGQQLVEVMKATSRVDLVRNLDHEVSKLSPHNIPTTTKLREMSRGTSCREYEEIAEPPYPDWFESIY